MSQENNKVIAELNSEVISVLQDLMKCYDKNPNAKGKYWSKAHPSDQLIERIDNLLNKIKHV